MRASRRSTSSAGGFTRAIASGSVTFSCAVSVGSRLNDWKTKPMCRRRSFVSCRSPMAEISSSPIRTVPEVGRSRPASRCISVDLPEPDGPITAVNWPEGTSSDTPRRASTADSPAPKRRMSARALIAVAVAGAIDSRGSVVIGGSSVFVGVSVGGRRRDAVDGGAERAGGPLGCEPSPPARRVSSPQKVILPWRRYEPGSSSRRTRRSSARRTETPRPHDTMRRMHALLGRLRALTPRRLDVLLAAAALVEMGAEVLLLTPLEGWRRLAGIGVVGLIAAAVLLRRRLPFAAIALAFGGLMAADRFGDAMIDHTAGPFFVIVFVTYSAGTVLEGRRLIAGALLATALLAISLDPSESDAPVANAIFSTVFVVAAPMLFGQLMVNRSRLHRALRAKADDAEAQRHAEAATAVLEERTRIAGELHDVVAHALSAMTVQAGGARRLAVKDPDRARAAFATVEGTGREALTELRRLLGVLRKEDEELALAPQPSLAHVDALTRRWQSAGLPVSLEVTGPVRALPVGVDLTAYRLVQEALGGAHDAGGAGRAVVRIAYGDADVRVDVADDGAPDGRQLLSMRERVAVYGGELTAAPADGGGWRISARLPVEAAP